MIQNLDGDLKHREMYLALNSSFASLQVDHTFKNAIYFSDCQKLSHSSWAAWVLKSDK